MARKRSTPEEIVSKLRQVEVLVAQGKPVVEAVRAIGVKRHPESSRGRHQKPSHPMGHADAPAWSGMVLDLSSPDRRFSRRR